MNIAEAKGIEGWMSEPELMWLASQARSHYRIIEIGCYKGRTTRALCDNTEGMVIAIDDFYGPREVHVEDRTGILDAYKNNTGSCSNLLTLIQDHNYPYVPHPKPDMVFIDGSHTYEDVLHSIKWWSNLLEPNGLICGHDYMTSWPGVDRAVRECFTQIGRPVDSIWVGEKHR